MWIEIAMIARFAASLESRPARALWIEIIKTALCQKCMNVEAREGLVD